MQQLEVGEMAESSVASVTNMLYHMMSVGG